MHALSVFLNIAAGTCSGSQISGGCLPQPSAGPGEVSTVINVALGMIGALALLMITLSGLRYITAAGNPEKTAKAKNGLIYSLIGLVVAISAEAIVAFAVGKL
ncbi:MAG TPA: pilin [Candidatus Dormibacteraeota bacterium]|nr:pilin [Candidatus Dormibacteraeota bacterium]